MPNLRDIIGDTYLILRNYLPEEKALQIGKNYKKEAEDNNYGPQAKNLTGNCRDTYNHLEMYAVLAAQTYWLNGRLGRQLLPTYNFTRMYLEGSTLGRHKDRQSCEVSLSIHLYGDAEWSFGIVDRYGEEVEITLQPGDAILYDSTVDHWRPGEYDGEFYVQSFQHYVFLEGKHANNVFDRNNDHENIKSYIRHLPGKIDSELCDRVVEHITQESVEHRWETATTASGDDGYRVCDTFGMNDVEEPELDAILYNKVNLAVKEYALDYSQFHIETDSGYNCLRYHPGGKYEPHIDHGPNHNRVATVIINLNDEYEGGELYFPELQMTYSLKKGDMMIFPSNFMFPHQIKSVKSGIRYSIVTWVV